ncbi:MAG: hypothetical protein ACYC1M_15550 [Armatimonadota bacterium]
MNLAHTIDAYHVIRAAAYVMAVIGLGVVVGRAILRQKRWLIVASLLPTILALLMAYPFFVLFHPLIYFSPEMDQLPGPGTILLLAFCGLPVAICALPYTVAFATWTIQLTRRERRKVSALKSTSTRRYKKGIVDESTEEDRE